VEKVHDRLYLVLWHIGTQDESFEVESVHEKLDTVSSHDVFTEDEGFSFADCKLDKGKQEDKFVDSALTKSVEMFSLFELSLFTNRFILDKLDNERLLVV
jgi:hypothetical protein